MEFRPGRLEQVWLRLVVPGFVVGWFLFTAAAALQDGDVDRAAGYAAVTVALAGVAYALDSRTPWAVRLTSSELELRSRWRPVVVWVRRLDELLAELRERAPLVSIRE